MDGYNPAGSGPLDSCKRAVLMVGKPQLATKHESAGFGNHACHPIKLPNTERTTVSRIGKPLRMSVLRRRQVRAKQHHHEKEKERLHTNQRRKIMRLLSRESVNEIPAL